MKGIIVPGDGLWLIGRQAVVPFFYLYQSLYISMYTALTTLKNIDNCCSKHFNKGVHWTSVLEHVPYMWSRNKLNRKIRRKMQLISRPSETEQHLSGVCLLRRHVKVSARNLLQKLILNPYRVKSRLRFDWLAALIFCTGHGSALRKIAKFGNDLTIEMEVMDELDLGRFQFRMSFGKPHHGATAPLKHIEVGQNGCHFPDDIFKCIFLNENVLISIKISPKFVPKGPMNNIPVLVQIMAWHRPGDKPLSESMMVSLLTHILHTSLGLNEF